MKRLMSFTIAASLIFSSVQAQNVSSVQKDVSAAKIEKKDGKAEKKSDKKELRKLEGKEVSYQSNQQFLTDFSNATIIRSRRSRNFDEFTFKNSTGAIVTAYYDDQANLVGTTQMKKFKDLPEKARIALKKDYKDYTIGKVIFFDDNEANETDMILFDTQFDDADSYFVVLKKENQRTILQVGVDGSVTFFTKMK